MDGKWVSFQASRHDEQSIVMHKFVELVLVVRSKSVKILINLVQLSPLSYIFSFFTDMSCNNGANVRKNCGG